MRYGGFDPVRWIGEEVLHHGARSHDGCDLCGSVAQALNGSKYRLVVCVRERST